MKNCRTSSYISPWVVMVWRSGICPRTSSRPCFNGNRNSSNFWALLRFAHLPSFASGKVSKFGKRQWSGKSKPTPKHFWPIIFSLPFQPWLKLFYTCAVNWLTCSTAILLTIQVNIRVSSNLLSIILVSNELYLLWQLLRNGILSIIWRCRCESTKDWPKHFVTFASAPAYFSVRFNYYTTKFIPFFIVIFLSIIDEACLQALEDRGFFPDDEINHFPSIKKMRDAMSFMDRAKKRNFCKILSK